MGCSLPSLLVILTVLTAAVVAYPRPRRSVKVGTVQWPGGIVPFDINTSAFTTHELAIIEAVFDDFHAFTPIRFQTRTSQAFYLYIDKTSDSSFCGFTNGFGPGAPRSLFLSSACISSAEPGTVFHEIMHAMGFVHEQTRQGRDQCVHINTGNVCGDDNIKSQFKQVDALVFDQLYDYSSVMHYPATAFSCNSLLPTLSPFDKSASIGQRIWFSKLDVVKINLMYGVDPPENIPSEVRLKTCDPDDPPAACFHGEEWVTCWDAPLGEEVIKHVRDVRVGDLILSVSPLDLRLMYEPVYLVIKHWPPARGIVYRRITTRSGCTLTLTPEHLLYTSSSHLVSAGDVRVGDVLYTTNGTSPNLIPDVTQDVSDVTLDGAYNLEVIGSMPLVSGVLASSYTSHGLMPSATVERLVKWPVRMAYHLLPVLYQLGAGSGDNMPAVLRLIRYITERISMLRHTLNSQPYAQCHWT